MTTQAEKNEQAVWDIGALSGIAADAWGRRPAEPPAGSIFELLQGEGYALLIEQDDEVVLGGIDRPWRVFGSEAVSVTVLAEFQAFDRPGWAKVAANLRVEARDGRTRLTTETRVRATSADARWKFRAYWFVIMPGSALIRRLWLRAARRNAEALRRLAPVSSCAIAIGSVHGGRSTRPAFRRGAAACLLVCRRCRESLLGDRDSAAARVPFSDLDLVVPRTRTRVDELGTEEERNHGRCRSDRDCLRRGIRRGTSGGGHAAGLLQR